MWRETLAFRVPSGISACNFVAVQRSLFRGFMCPFIALRRSGNGFFTHKCRTILCCRNVSFLLIVIAWQVRTVVSCVRTMNTCSAFGGTDLSPKRLLEPVLEQSLWLLFAVPPHFGGRLSV